MKYFCVLFLTLNSFGLFANEKYPKRQINITHDYLYSNAIKKCKNNGGFHYMVHITDLETDFSKRDIKHDMGPSYPCTQITKIRCQNGKLFDFATGVGFCFINQMQLDETLGEIDK